MPVRRIYRASGHKSILSLQLMPPMGADIDTGEERRVLPSSKHTLADEMGQVDLTLNSVVVTKPDSVGLKCAHLYRARQQI